MSNNTIYYVYAYLRSEDSANGKAGTPYYIGKGKDGRAYVQHKSGKRGKISTPRNKDNIQIFIDNLTEADALYLEIAYIRKYGRLDIGTGILRNETDGGEGTSGIQRDDAWRENQRKSQTGKTRSKETRQNMSLVSKGKAKSENHKANIGKALRGENNGMYGKKPSNTLKIPYNGSIYYGWKEFEAATGISQHRYKKMLNL